MSSTAAATNLWLGDVAAAVQGTWQAMAPGHGDARARQQQKLGRERKTAAAQAGAAVAAAKEGGDGDVGRCGGAMSDTTLYLLLDRFSPS